MLSAVTMTGVTDSKARELLPEMAFTAQADAFL